MELPMRKGFMRLVAVVVTGSVLSLSGAAMAAASPTGTEGHGSGVSATQSSAATLQELHDQLKSAVDAKDVSGVMKAVDQLRPELSAVHNLPVERSTMNQADIADQKAAQAQRDLPSLPDPLTLLGGLLQGLLTAVQALIGALLGALPVPIPVPVPPLPVPVPAP
jgi:hypothetical protein